LASHPIGNNASSFGQSSSSPGATLAFLAALLSTISLLFLGLVSAYGINPLATKSALIVPCPRTNLLPNAPAWRNTTLLGPSDFSLENPLQKFHTAQQPINHKAFSQFPNRS
jgi:hypothetical protein